MTLPYYIIVPLFAAFLITLIAGRKDGWGITISMIAAVSLLIISVYDFATLGGESETLVMGGWIVPIGIVLVKDALSCFMLIITSLIATTTLLYSIQYVRHLSQDWKYYALFMLLLTGMNGVLITGDLFNLFVFMEIALLAAFALVAFGGRAEEFEAAFKYAVMGSVSSSIVLVGIAVTYSATSTLTMANIAESLRASAPALTLWIGAIFLAGFGLKAAAMPFHAWLPDAHSSAPAPISSMLSGVLIKVLGIYVIIRLFYHVLGAPRLFLTFFLVLGAISVIISGVLSVGQWDIKRLLAYSSISQIGYILLGLGIATPLGILGAVFHLFNHAIFKSLLFYNAGSAELVSGTRDIRKMGALGKIIPVTSGTSLIASLAISGIPPFNGFFSKLLIIIALVQSGQPYYAVIAIVGSLLTLAALMKVQRHGFHGDAVPVAPKERIGFNMDLAMIILAVICVVSSLLIVPGIKEVTLQPIVDVIMHGSDYTQLVMGR